MRRLFVCFISLIVIGIHAQDGENLLRDPGFENTAMKVVVTSEGEGVTFAVNQDWNGWYTESPRTADWQNRIPNGTGRNNAGMGFVRSGNRSMELSRGYATFTAAVFQTVSVPAGSVVTGSAWYVMDLSEGASAQARVGIDPNGGTNPYDSDIAWSSWGGNQLASSGFRQLSVSTTATGESVTLFLFATQTVPSAQNGIFWDDASLVITGQAVQPTQPSQPDQPVNTPVPASTRAPVVPVTPAADGSIIHIVQSGETLSAIAQAYGLTVEDILPLNPDITNPRLIFTGQRINIRLAEGATVPSTPVSQTNTPQIAPPPATLPGGVNNIVAATFTLPPVAQADADANNMTQTGEICVNTYEDTNINNKIDVSEVPLAGSTITLLQRETGETVMQHTTTGERDNFCFQDLQSMGYIVVASVPEGYGFTTSSSFQVELTPGASFTLLFGAAQGVQSTLSATNPTSSALIETSTQDSNNETSVLIQNIGLIIFGLAALTLFTGMLAVYVLQRRY
ncbi:MAG: hypothetical protein CUN56_07945 [Phototrophicales bacterium]|nr:MAG: hypothetical protein CUN56_07945 [Phototrophicales bacterium]